MSEEQSENTTEVALANEEVPVDIIHPLQLLQIEWANLNREDRLEKFKSLDREMAEDLFLAISPSDQAELICDLPAGQRRSWLRMLPLDDTADVIQHLPEDYKKPCFELLDPGTQTQVRALLAYAEDDAGGLMTPHFIRLRPNMEVEVAIRYLRAHSRHHENTIYYTYVVDTDEKLVGVLSLREILLAAPNKKVADLMKTDLITVIDTMDQESVARVFSSHSLTAIPVVDADGRLKGVVTYDDISNAIEKEATEDIQKIGGMEALDLPYWKTNFFTMIRKRAGWLVILLLGEMLTTAAMSHYEHAIAQALVLTLFIPLIISSGGNSGSQASTLIIRAMVLNEIKIAHWWRVLLRELSSGVVLGSILGLIGFVKIAFWPNSATLYGEHYMRVAVTVGFSLMGVVLWGATTGSMLPFLLRKLRLDPASASAPLVATVVDVTGLIIYFTIASYILTGSLI